MAKLTIQQLLRDVGDLPALPDVAVKVIRATSDAGADAQRLARIISADQAFTARVLRIANSTFYGLSRRIGTVTEAVVLLGMNRVRALAIAAATYDLLGREHRGYALSKGELWRHSIGAALTAQLLAKAAGMSGVENAFVAGLLHDLGKCVLDRYVEAYLPELMGATQTDGLPFPEAEREVIGFDHAELGGQCAEMWRLPQDLVEAIRFHHEPSRAGEISQLLAVTHIADVVCMSLGIGLGGDGLMYRMDDRALERLGLSHADLMKVMSEAVHVISSSRPLFELDLFSPKGSQTAA